MAVKTQTDVKRVLRMMGWRVDTAARARRAIGDFQRGWNLGTALKVDELAGPSTRSALAISERNTLAGKPNFSPHFNAKEFACGCWGKYSDCRRIMIQRSTVQLAEKWRAGTRPFSPDRAYRCPRFNADVDGAHRSQHLYGNGLDVPVTNISLAAARKIIGTNNGIGTYTKNGQVLVRHIDNRGEWAQWSYGTYSGSVIRL